MKTRRYLHGTSDIFLKVLCLLTFKTSISFYQARDEIAETLSFRVYGTKARLCSFALRRTARTLKCETSVKLSLTSWRYRVYVCVISDKINA